KPYRNRSLDSAIRKHRTIHEAKFISDAKSAGVLSPFIYFVDPVNAEIIMEFIEGRNVRETVTPALCSRIGRYAGMLHAVNIIHGDLTTSNFIVNRNRLVIIDFGLAFYSERTEDAATDVRLIKAVFASAHVKVTHAFDHFIAGYSNVLGEKKTKMVLRNVAEIEQRGRYARVT
ncbi:MAG TPA: KEOPS complex kinase/ATPase Bud32, partial [Nitrososphaera sp.]|nr:KEOPS complex kinase/ATPase Bud32 [Nitrososphaera sp.]